MTYTVLARRYRSRDFDEVVGQEPIARTLRRAIESGRTAHAYLFSGTRGVGKTSMARIFAKAINVNDDLADREAISDAIMRGEDLDVIEIDGASNNRVEDARELIANSIYRPARCPYKIYIIDEVHMLSNSAFNALLKTMEEPPAHVKFILCTTEPEKVPSTIQSRCQRFDFRAIPHGRIVDHLRHVLEQENVEADDAVVHHVARLGNGSMRDALSVLERLLASGEGRITRELLESTLGLPDFHLVNQLVRAIAGGDPAAALIAAGELTDRGISTDQMLESLIDSFRELMIVSACGPETRLVQFATAADQTERLEQARRFDLGGLVHTIVMLENVQRAAKGSGAARALVEAALVRLAMSEQMANLAAVLRDPRMVSRLPMATSPGPGATGPAPTAGAGEGTAPSGGSAGPEPRKKKRLSEPDDAVTEAEALPPATATVARRDVPAPAEASAGAAVVAAPAPDVPPSPGRAIDIDGLWQDAVHAADATNPGLSAALEALHLVAIEGRTGIVEVRDESMRRFAESKQQPLADLLSRLSGQPLAVRFAPPAGFANGAGGDLGGPRAGAMPSSHLRGGPGPRVGSAAPGVPDRATVSPGGVRPASAATPPTAAVVDPAEVQALREEAARDPRVRLAMSLLDARIVHVERPRPAGDIAGATAPPADALDEAAAHGDSSSSAGDRIDTEGFGAAHLGFRRGDGDPGGGLGLSGEDDEDVDAAG